jgi:hypothetical protein
MIAIIPAGRARLASLRFALATERVLRARSAVQGLLLLNRSSRLGEPR